MYELFSYEDSTLVYVSDDDTEQIKRKGKVINLSQDFIWYIIFYVLYIWGMNMFVITNLSLISNHYFRKVYFYNMCTSSLKHYIIVNYND